MSDNTGQTDISLVFTDQDQNYYVIPVEVFERGRVPAEHKAEVEEALREQDVSGYFLLHAAVGMAVGGSILIAGAVVGAGAVVAGAVVGASIAQSR